MMPLDSLLHADTMVNETQGEVPRKLKNTSMENCLDVT